MAYFRELPNIKYASIFDGGRPSKDSTLVKNIFKRPKIRSDIKDKITTFYNYTIRDGERPDQIAKKIYNNPELDWLILITNNITNVNEQWPLDNSSFYSYLLDKYGSEEALLEVHHYESREVRDEYNRIVVPGGIEIDQLNAEEFTTTENKLTYDLNSFPSSKFGSKVTVNLNQLLRVFTQTGLTLIDITDINGRTSNLHIKTRSNTTVEIQFVNNLFNWPNGWGGVLTAKKRDGQLVENIVVGDQLLNNDIEIPEGLYRIVGREDNGTLIPVFEFRNELAVT
jgi:hypothetical protein